MEDDSMTENIYQLKELLVLITGSTHNRYIHLDEEVDEEAVKQWFRQLNQEVKMASTSLDYQVKGHKFIVPQFFKLLHHCCLSQRWPEAFKILEALAYEPKGTSQTIWRAGMEALYSNPEENDAFISQLFRQLKLLKDVHAEDIVLEYVMYLLSQGRATEAAVVIKQKEQKRTGQEKMVNLPAHRPAVYRAYKGLVWYVEWLLLKHRTHEGDKKGETWQSSSQADYQHMKVMTIAQKAISSMEGLCDEPGIWDTFIIKLVELKEEYESVESARTVLTRYRDQNPDNPNCHRYLYQFHVKHGASDSDKVRVLKDLADRDPSNPLVLDLCHLLNGSPSVVRHLFEMLDYCNWRDKVEPWKKFRKYLVSVYTSNLSDNKQVVEECWQERDTWWPAYHFQSGSVCSYKSDAALLFEKAVCCEVLMGRGNAYTEECVKMFSEKQMHRLSKVRKALAVT